MRLYYKQSGHSLLNNKHNRWFGRCFVRWEFILHFTNYCISDDGPVGLVIGIDLLPIAPLPGAVFLDSTDFTDPSVLARIEKVKETRPFQVINTVISDMSPNATGIKSLDHELSTELCLSALKFALTVLPHGGHFISKLLQGQEQKRLEILLAKFFRTVSVFKPKASRLDSCEIYLVAKKRIMK